MSISKHRTAILVTAGALALGGTAIAAPAVAGPGTFGGPVAAATQEPGFHRHGGGMGPGAGNGMGTGDRSCLSTVPTGTLSAEQKTTLAAMAQEEKLAHDLYTAFADRYDAVVFDRIVRSESRHLAAIRLLLDRYGLADPTVGRPAGQFSDDTVQATYDRLLAQGNANLSAALLVGQEVERTDIADLRAALAGLTAPDVTHVYAMLLNASERHLSSFQSR